MTAPRDRDVDAIFLRPKEAARAAGIGLTKFYELMNEGKIASRKVGAMRLIDPASLKALGGAAPE